MKIRILRSLAFITSACIAMCSCSVTKKNSKVEMKNSVQEANSSLTEINEKSYKVIQTTTLDELNTIYDIKQLNEGGYCASGYDESNNPFLYKINSDFSDIHKVYLDLPDQVKQTDNKYVKITFNQNGESTVLYTISDFGVETLSDDNDSLYGEPAISSILCFYNSDGKIKSCIDLSNEKDFSYSENDWYVINSLMPDSDTLLMLLNTKKTYVIKSDGKHEPFNWGIDNSDPNDNNVKFLLGSDNNTYVYLSHSELSGDSDEEYGIYKADLEKNNLGSIVYAEKNNPYGYNSSYIYCTGYGDYLFTGISSDNVIGIKADGTTEKIFSWIDTDIAMMNIVPTENDGFYGWINADDKNSVEIYKFVLRTPEELSERKIITIATLGSNILDGYISKFNREQDKYRIQVVDYNQKISYDENDSETSDPYKKIYNECYKQLKLDIVSGNSPDILMLDRNDIELLGNKGFLLDLNTIMKNDSEINRDTVLSNILNALENSNGNLYSLTPNFTVSTFAAKKKLFDHENWNLKEMLDFYDSNNAIHSYDIMTKDEMLNIILNGESNLIDFEKAECHFNTPEFINCLKFCNRFVREIELADKSNANEFQSYWADRANWLANEQSLVSSVNLTGITDLIYEKNDFGDEELTLVGYPTSNQKGGKLHFYYELSICADSSIKEGAWEFIKMIIKDCADNAVNSDPTHYEFTSGYSILKDTFNKQIDSMATIKQYDENGKIIKTKSFESQGRSINVLTSKELSDLKNYILGCDTILNSFGEDIYSVCCEEADAFFNGEKTADEAAGMMQNRISILVSERS